MRRSILPKPPPVDDNRDLATSSAKKKRFRRDYSAFYNESTSRLKPSISSPSYSSTECQEKEPHNDPTVCPVKDCKGENHMSCQYTRHRFKEACLIYHNISPEDCLKINLARKLVCDLETVPISYDFRVSTRDQKKAISELENQREEFDEALRKRVAKGYYDDIFQSSKFDRNCEPLLNDFAISRDLELFRMAQVAAAQELEEKPQYLNQASSRIKTVRIGSFEIETQNPSCYPDDISCLEKIYICEYCLKYTKSLAQLSSHGAKCAYKHPPGVEVYKKQPLSVWQVDGSENKIFCQNLCLLAKLFLDHKTLYYDVEPFLFYILTEKSVHNSHIVGYFSKEKESMMNCNLSCLLILPPYQSRGYGKILIELSYLLSKSEDKIGSPEHPLSDLGLAAYRSYWKEKILEYMVELEDQQGFSVKDLSQKTAIHVNDLVSTLQYYGLVKYWRHEYWVLKKQEFIDEYKKSAKKKAPSRRIDPSCLKAPFVKRESNNATVNHQT